MTMAIEDEDRRREEQRDWMRLLAELLRERNDELERITRRTGRLLWITLASAVLAGVTVLGHVVPGLVGAIL